MSDGDKLLITGSSGFIGRYLIQNPKLKYFDVLTPSHKELNLMNPKNIKEYIEKNKPVYLIHLAWITTPGEYKTSLENIKWVNASDNLFNEFYKVCGLKTIGVGTGFEYEQKSGYFIEDVTPTIPDTLYGTCKLHTNEILKQHYQPYSWVRPFNVYGYGEPKSKIVTDIITSLIHSKTTIINNPDAIADFIYVKDVANILMELLYNNHRTELNISSGEATTMREIAEYIGIVLNKENLIEYKTGSPSMYVGNNSKLKRMGLSLSYSLENGIDEMIEKITGSK